MVQNLLGGQPLRGLPAAGCPDEALGLGLQSLWNVELATPDLAEETWAHGKGTRPTSMV